MAAPWPHVYNKIMKILTQLGIFLKNFPHIDVDFLLKLGMAAAWPFVCNKIMKILTQLGIFLKIFPHIDIDFLLKLGMTAPWPLNLSFLGSFLFESSTFFAVVSFFCVLLQTQEGLALSRFPGLVLKIKSDLHKISGYIPVAVLRWFKKKQTNMFPHWTQQGLALSRFPGLVLKLTLTYIFCITPIYK